MTRPSALGRLPTDGDSAEEFAEVTLDGMGTLGDTTARLDGEPINVFGGIPGERVIARIWRYRRRRQSIVSGIVTEVLEPSPHRVSTPCPYVGDCTGCQWQHIEYGHQLHLKRQAILDWFAKSPGLEKITVEPAIAAGQTFEYRNHARFTVRRNGVLGFMNRITRRFIEIPKCILMDPWINETLSGLQGNCGETSQLSVRYGVNTGDWLVQPHLQDERIGKPTGQPYYFEELHGHRFRIGSPSFFQVNTRQAERLSQLVAERLRLSGNETVVDAYAGVGTFAVGIVADAGRVIAVEESSAAVGDAAINTLGMSNIEYRLGRTEEVVAELFDTEKRSRWIAEAVAELTEREQIIIRERRLSEEIVTLERLGRRLGISKERVRQIEHQAIGKLREALETHREAMI